MRENTQQLVDEPLECVALLGSRQGRVEHSQFRAATETRYLVAVAVRRGGWPAGRSAVG